MDSSGHFLGKGWRIGGHFVRSAIRKQSVQFVPRMLRNAPLLRRDAQLIGGP
jgi:hypothetical protein